jgi:hypothetical protein
MIRHVLFLLTFMGGSKNFSTHVAPYRLYARDSARWLHGTHNGRFVVDASVILRCVQAQENIGARLFLDQRPMIALDRLAQIMIHYLSFLPHQLTFVFEVGAAFKTSRTKRQIGRARKLNTAIRQYYSTWRYLGLQKLNAAAALHTKHQLCLASLLKERYGFDVVVAYGDGDIAISQIARAKKRQFRSPVYVVSSDYDFLVFPPADSFDGMITPAIGHRSIINRLAFLHDHNHSLMVSAYCAAGCDNVKGIARIGMKTALQEMDGCNTLKECFSALASGTTT